ncbi:MAG: hypothetical protein LBK27_00845 [Treponema sp.]|jgi:hypothetical protein|nr:hypothetical protein [Treponema sp.]
MNKPAKRRIFFILLRAAILFFFGLCLFSLFLYAAGTRQNFTDETQLLLLALSRNLGLALSISSVCGIGYCVWHIVRDSRFRLVVRAAAYLLLCLFGLAVEFLAAFIIAAAGGTA